MPKVTLPDGSRLVAWHEADEPFLSEAAEELETLVQRLRMNAQDSIGMAEMRRLLAEVHPDSDKREHHDEHVLTELGVLVKGGFVVWETSATKAKGVLGGGGSKPKPVPPPPPPKPEKVEVHVTPHLNVEMKVVLFDRGLEKHLADPKYLPGPTFITCALTQSPHEPKFTKGANLKVEGAGAVEAYEDEKLTKKFDISKPIPNDKLTKADPLKLWLKGKTKGKFELKLEVESPSAPFKAEKPATAKMGVVEVQMKLHDEDLDEIKKLQVDPDVDPYTTYFDNLKAKAIPAQKELSDEDKIKKGRILHAQDAGHHGRAKLVLKKLAAAEWPDGTDAYELVLTCSESADESKVNTALDAFDKETEGSSKTTVTVSEAKGADVTLWVEGKTASKKPLDTRLDLGVSGEGKKKRNGDWARFTIVKIKEVTILASSDAKKAQIWDSVKKRFFINTAATPAGRELKDDPGVGKKVKITARLTEKIKDIQIHFMLAGSKENVDAAKWTPGFKYGKLDKPLKAVDKKDRKDVIHLSAVTDAEGASVMKDLVLSRLGLEKYRIGAYIAQDPHLAKYVDGHADLGKRKPVLGDELQVWRRVWVQLTYNKTAAPVSRALTVTAFDQIALDYKEVDEKKFNKASIPGLVEHEAWQFQSDGDTKKIICVGAHNSAKFHGQFVAPSVDHKPKSHMILCEAQWDPAASGLMTWDTSANPSTQNCVDGTGSSFQGVIKPPLNGAPLLTSGIWTWNDGATLHNGIITEAMVTIEKARTHHATFKVALPPKCLAVCAGCGGGTAIAVSAAKKAKITLQLNSAAGPYAGESGTPHCLIVLDSNLNIFNNTITHEIGHQFNQVRSTKSWLGLPDHPDYYIQRGGVGPHCKKDATEHATAVDEAGAKQYVGGTCIMYHVAVGNVTFCANCKTDLRARNLTDFALDS